MPVFELDPSWPAPLADADAPWPDPDRNATSVAVDPRDHVWMMQLPTPEEFEAEMAGGPQVPRVFEFDPAGNVIRSWGGPETSDAWMLPPDPDMPYPSGTPAEHGMFVDHGNNVWVTGNGHVALKFSPDGELLLQVGEPGQTKRQRRHGAARQLVRADGRRRDERAVRRRRLQQPARHRLRRGER